MSSVRFLLAAALALAAAAILVVVELQADATHARDKQQRVVALQLELIEARDIPWDPEARDELIGAVEGIRARLAALGLDRRPEIRRHLDPAIAAMWTILRASRAGDDDAAGAASETAAVEGYAANAALRRAGREFRTEALSSLRLARWGAAGVIVLLFGGFAWFALRSTRARRRVESLHDEVTRLLALSQEEAATDALTGLRNRRALAADLARAVPEPGAPGVMIALFDLDGFKQYNDLYGHSAGDELLARLGARLETTMQGVGVAYRMGGDEFCVLAPAGSDGGESIARLAAAALTDEGTGFVVGCSYGVALLPADTSDATAALTLADQRMYAQKAAGRASAGRQSADVLLRVLAERNIELERHIAGVATLAASTARQLGMPDDDIRRIELAAQLHDVGKAAIPDAILDKPGPLDDEERRFIERHTVIGERIVLAAPSLAAVAPLIRSSHERVDGTGYPDGLAGEDIPLGARVIAVCDAYEAMIAERPYAAPCSHEDALAELLRCAGGQFDADVVEAFCAIAGRPLQTA